ncbi:hypothetical protein AC579_5591 [Pseudocercospora musae]|uniref:Uncharacterized protein n=1 Tax=Pseudocercospora musae TaxID=113226 RepID=A0A139INR3_9PEZI|nr:hypothetical protein AC579_5591 [Pseudocercospora musae]
MFTIFTPVYKVTPAIRALGAPAAAPESAAMPNLFLEMFAQEFPGSMYAARSFTKDLDRRSLHTSPTCHDRGSSRSSGHQLLTLSGCVGNSNSFRSATSISIAGLEHVALMPGLCS